MSRSPATPFDVNGRTVFITGAARGIGKAAAERLHAKGANVALVGLEPERLEENAARLGDRAAHLRGRRDRLRRAAAGRRGHGRALRRDRRGDRQRRHRLHRARSPRLRSSTSSARSTVNLLGVWRTDRAVIEQITERRGYLLNIASLSAIAHTPLMGPYTTAKSGVEALTDALRMETLPSGARVGCAYFGFIDTDLVRAAYAQPSVEVMNEQMPAFMRNPAPLSKAIDAIEQGIERRAARVWSPRWVGPAMLRCAGIVQPLIERRPGARLEPR